MNKLLTESELANELGLSAWTVRRWRLTAELPVIKVGGRFLYRIESVEHWLESQETVTKDIQLPDEIGKIRQVRE